MRRLPKQQRSRARIDEIVAAADRLLAESPAHELTIGRLAAASGVPTSSIYRYFADKDAVLAAVLDREMEALDQATAVAFLQLERITLRATFEVGLRTHLAHHRARPWLVPLWFGEPRSAVVAARVRAMGLRTGQWLEQAVQAANLIQADTPPHRPDMLIRLCDRTLEYVLTSGLSAAEQDEAIDRFVDMVASYVERWATPDGLNGISLEQFAAALGPAPEHRAADES